MTSLAGCLAKQSEKSAVEVKVQHMECQRKCIFSKLTTVSNRVIVGIVYSRIVIIA